MKKLCDYSHVLWDLNGTLLDDLDVGLAVQAVMLRERGLPPLTKERYLATFNFPIKDWYAYLGYDISTYDQLAVVWAETYAEMVKAAPIGKGVLPLMEAIDKAGVGQSVFTAGERAMATALLRQMGIENRFAHVFALDDHLAHTKLSLCESVKKALPGPYLLIGDTTQDFLSAQALGCDCALVACGHQNEQTLKNTGAPVFADIEALTDALTGQKGTLQHD